MERDEMEMLSPANVRDKTLDPTYVHEVLKWLSLLVALGLADVYWPPSHAFVNCWFGHALFPNEGKRATLEEVMTDWYPQLRNHPAIGHALAVLAVAAEGTAVEPERDASTMRPWLRIFSWGRGLAKRLRHLMVPTTLLLSLALVAACDLGGLGPTGPSGGNTGTAGFTPTPITPHREHLTVMYCPESSGKYPRTLLQQANAYMAASLDAAVRANQDGVDGFVTPINSHTYDETASGAFTIQIPPTTPEPTPPILEPVPTVDPTHMYDSGAKHNAAEHRNQDKIDAYQAALAKEQADLAVVRAQVKHQTDQLRAFTPPVDQKHPTDASVWACALKASQRLANARGARWLVFASSMDETEFVDVKSLQLSGCKVRVIWYDQTGQTSRFAAYKEATWRDALRNAGVADGDIQFFDPQASAVLPLLFGMGR